MKNIQEIKHSDRGNQKTKVFSSEAQIVDNRNGKLRHGMLWNGMEILRNLQVIDPFGLNLKSPSIPLR